MTSEITAKKHPKPNFFVVVHCNESQHTFNIHTPKSTVQSLKSQIRRHWQLTKNVCELYIYDDDKVELCDGDNFTNYNEHSEFSVAVEKNLKNIVMVAANYDTKQYRFSQMIGYFTNIVNNSRITKCASYLFHKTKAIANIMIWKPITFLWHNVFYHFFRFFSNKIFPITRNVIHKTVLNTKLYIYEPFLFPSFTFLSRYLIKKPASFAWDYFLFPLFKFLYRIELYIRKIIRESSFISSISTKLISTIRCSYLTIENFLQIHLFYPLFRYFLKPTFDMTIFCFKQLLLLTRFLVSFVDSKILIKFQAYANLKEMLNYYQNGNTRSILYYNNSIHLDVRPSSKTKLVLSDDVDLEPHYYLAQDTKFYFDFVNDSGRSFVVRAYRNGEYFGNYLLSPNNRYLSYKINVVIDRTTADFQYPNGFYFDASQLYNNHACETFTFELFNIITGRQRRLLDSKKKKELKKDRKRNNNEEVQQEVEKTVEAVNSCTVNNATISSKTEEIFQPITQSNMYENTICTPDDPVCSFSVRLFDCPSSS